MSAKVRHIHLNMLGNFKKEMDSNFNGSVGYRYPVQQPTSSMRVGHIRILLIKMGRANSGRGKLMWLYGWGPLDQLNVLLLLHLHMKLQ